MKKSAKSKVVNFVFALLLCYLAYVFIFRIALYAFSHPELTQTELWMHNYWDYIGAIAIAFLAYKLSDKL